MKEKKVKEVMIPVSDYATISENATLKDAIKALRSARRSTKAIWKHRALLALDENNIVTGKLSLWCIFKALEPKYRQFEHPENIGGSIGLSRFGFSEKFLASLLDNYNLWDETLEELLKKAAPLKVKDIMHSPGNGEYVNENSMVAEAVHQFIIGCHQSLLVLKNDNVTGIIRLVDLFDLLGEILEENQ